MLDKIKAVPEKQSFAIGLTLLFICYLSLSLPIGSVMTMIVAGVIGMFSCFFILNAADKRHERNRKGK